MNEYFQTGSVPSPSSPGSSAVIRGEFANIAAAFDRLPVMSSGPNEFVVVNATGTALITAGFMFSDLVSVTGAQTLINKTINWADNNISTIPIVGGGTGASDLYNAQVNLGINLKADADNAVLTGAPTAPTPPTGDTSVRLANTYFVTNTIAAIGAAIPSDNIPLANGVAGPGVAPFVSRDDHVHPVDTSRAPLSAGTAAGTSFAPTGTVAASTVQLAIAELDTEKAPLASPALTGTPTAPTPLTSDNDTSIATTAFVQSLLAQQPPGVQVSSSTPLVNGAAAPGTGVEASRYDHVHPIDTSRAPLASPTFTGTVGGITAAMVGLGNVDNTADANKPASTPQQAVFVSKTAANGSAQIPVGTSLQRDAAPAYGMIRYNSTIAQYECYLNGLWQSTSGILQPGTGAVWRKPQDKLNDTISVKDFGAVGNGITDDSAAINAAAVYAATLTAPRLVFPDGEYYCASTITLVLPNHSTIDFYGKIKSSVATGAAMIIGNYSTNPRGYRINGLKVYRTTNDTSAGTTGVQLRNLVSSYIDIRECMGFQDGVHCYGDMANGGFSYNEVHIGIIHDNKNNLHLGAASVGYCNENNFFGGSLNHSSGYPVVATTNLLIDHFATNELNNNRFFGLSFEDNSTLAIAVSMAGNNNVLYWPRIENPAIQTTYPIRFEAASNECELVGKGFTITNTNIVDLGSGNSYETIQGKSYKAQALSGAGNGVIRARSLATSAARVFVAENSSGTETAYMTGDGKVGSKSGSMTVANAGIGQIYQNVSATATYSAAIFLTGGGVTQVGGITVSSTATTYATSSDYRLKTNVAPMVYALEKINQLNPVTFDWIGDGSKGQGFIAHELQAVFPDAVTGVKDATDADGVPIYQGIDPRFIVPALVQATQELSARLATVEAKLARSTYPA